ncbi:MAG TPA: ATP-binding protein [Mucilaginibacter sp.]|nr:ATP-binding protein [Mucilaginibacter sp.]
MSITPAEANILNALDEAACIFEQLPKRGDGLRDYQYVFVNTAFRRLFGTPDLAGFSVRDNFPNEPESWYDDYDEVLNTGVPKHFIREAPSQEMIIEMYVTRLEGGTRKRLMNTLRDVTLENNMEGALRESESRLKESEANIRNLIMQAPVAMCLLTGPDFVIDIINDSFIAIWGKDRSVLGKPIMEALPEMKGQPYPDFLKYVYNTGQTYYGREDKALLLRDGKLETRYFNFVNEPYRNPRGVITGVIVVATEVTDQVLARLQLERTEQMLRLSVEAAKAASWSIDIVTRKLTVSKEFFKIYGLPEQWLPAIDTMLAQIPCERRAQVEEALERSLTDGADLQIEYPVNTADGLRWLRVFGKVSPASPLQAASLSGLTLDITEQKQDDLRKNDFIGMVSHELKTPLTSLTAMVQVLKAKLDGHENHFLANVAVNAEKQVKRMTRMINGFLNVSRLESGKILLNRERFELGQLVEELVAEMRLQNTGQTFEISNSQPVWVEADRDKIGSVISNLLSNAAKYSPKNTSVAITVETGDKQVIVSVRDYGLGIKPEDQEKLFDRYYRVDDQRTRHIAGFGIGLYLSAEIVRLHGGYIDVRSAPDQGSTFRFSLPL